MNILLFTNSFLPQVGGREIVVHYLAREYCRQGHQVRVVKPGGFSGMRKHKFPYRVHHWPTLKGRFNDQVYLGILLAETTLWPTDIIHAHSTYPCGYAASRLKRFRKNIPLVITPHGVDIHVIPKLNFGLRLDPEKDRKIRWALAKADAMTAISQSVAASIRNAGGSRNKTIQIPNGIDLERFASAAGGRSFYSWLQVEPEDKIILTVGNYHRRKGQEVLIKAMPAILAKEPRACLVIVGRDTGRLETLVTELGLQKRVRLTGLLPFKASGLNGGEDRLAELYAGCHLYISAAVDQEAEGLSLSLLDAMASGKPIVATDISGNRDVVENGINGLLVPPANHAAMAEAVISLLSHGEKRDVLGCNGYAKAEAMSWTNTAGIYLDLYRRLLELPPEVER